MYKILSEVGGFWKELLDEYSDLEIIERGKRDREEVLEIIPEFSGLIAGATFDFNKN